MKATTIEPELSTDASVPKANKKKVTPNMIANLIAKVSLLVFWF